ncbi:DinB family protein [Falsibacillus albus]|uniref:Damage-inducible protein DinB n=1 Tax=Falsibacillus albus TaxID=2478915 RepID=A0A3L7JNB6_9BACI|nr:DinB family protein [Falsibacillus albus]RLQ92273.1 damage-inducible protein DinB [Falsibacillus albus]
MDVLAKQYDWIKRTRELLFQYCESLPQEDYVKELEIFAGDSILSSQVHVANCYRWWLGVRTLGKSYPETTPESVKDINGVRSLFKEVDDLVQEFLSEFQGDWDKIIHMTLSSGEKLEPTTLWLYTHTTTHEFHHKGQIVKMGRYLGHIPPDTDLIEPPVL